MFLCCEPGSGSQHTDWSCESSQVHKTQIGLAIPPRPNRCRRCRILVWKKEKKIVQYYFQP